MGLGTLPDRTNGQTIDENWFNTLKTVLKQDFLPRNTSGVVTDAAGSIGSSTYWWLSIFGKAFKLLGGTKVATIQAHASQTADYSVTLPQALPGSTLPMFLSATGQVDTTGQVPTGSIADSAVTTAKIADSNVTTGKLNNLAVTNAKLGDASVNAQKIEDGQVTVAKQRDKTLSVSSAAAGDVVRSTSSLTYNNTGVSLNYITSHGPVSIVATGRPIDITLISDGSPDSSMLSVTGTLARFRLMRSDDGGSTYNAISYQDLGGTLPPSAYAHRDVVGGGTRYYRLDVANFTSSAVEVKNCYMLVEER